MLETWTIQSKEVFEIINNRGIYLPSVDFAEIEEMKLCYYAAVSGYNLVNNEHLSGVVFAMAPSPLMSFSTSQEVREFFEHNPTKLNYLKKNGVSLIDDNHFLLKLRYVESFNPIPIDIDAFVAFSDYLSLLKNEYGQLSLRLSPICEEDSYFPRINAHFNSWIKGEYTGPFAEESARIYRNFETLIQLHLPYIKKENIVFSQSVGKIFSGLPL